VLSALRGFFAAVVLEGESAYVCEHCCRGAYEAEARRLATDAAQRAAAVAALCENMGDVDTADTVVAAVEESSGDDEEAEEDEEGCDGDVEDEAQSGPSPGPAEVLQTLPTVDADSGTDAARPPSLPPASAVPLPPPPPASAASALRQTATMVSTVTELRDVVIVHLKRFAFNMRTMAWQKSHAAVAFDARIDLSEFVRPAVSAGAAALRARYPNVPLPVLQNILGICGDDVAAAAALLDEGVRFDGGTDAVPPVSALYRLTGIVEHRGTAGGGHYVAYVYSTRAAAWFLCNDGTVTAVTDREVMASEPYLLFYQRTNS
jgi:hypothetical protein